MDIQEQPITVSPIQDGYAVKLIGAIHTNTAWIEGELKKIAAAKPPHVDVDLSETTFMSSMAIGLLVYLYNKVSQEGGSVQIVSIRRRVLSTLKFAGLERMMVSPHATILQD